MLTKKTVSLILLLVFIIFAYHHRGARDRITSLSEKINKNLPNFIPKQSYFAKFTEETFFKYLGLTGFNEYLIRLTPYEAAILKKTLDFMVEKRDPEDPELVAFVKTLITPPFQKSQRKLSDPKKTDWSQIGQSGYIDEALGAKTRGFYVEAGGYDGETYSNSLFFELERDWNGVLIEAVKPLYESIIQKRRHCHVINACLADRVQVGKMRVFNISVLSGLETEMDGRHKNRGMAESSNRFEFFFTPCFSLVTILKALDVKQVDYFSLDVEGLIL